MYSQNKVVPTSIIPSPVDPNIHLSSAPCSQTPSACILPVLPELDNSEKLKDHI